MTIHDSWERGRSKTEATCRARGQIQGSVMPRTSKRGKSLSREMRNSEMDSSQTEAGSRRKSNIAKTLGAHEEGPRAERKTHKLVGKGVVSPQLPPQEGTNKGTKTSSQLRETTGRRSGGKKSPGGTTTKLVKKKKTEGRILQETKTSSTRGGADQIW